MQSVAADMKTITLTAPLERGPRAGSQVIVAVDMAVLRLSEYADCGACMLSMPESSPTVHHYSNSGPTPSKISVCVLS